MLGITTHAILRTVGNEIKNGIAQDLNREDPNPELAKKQHANYTHLLNEMGLQTIVLPADPKFPDGTFVEDTYVITPNVIIEMRPGVKSRVNEGESIKPVLPKDRPILSLPSLKYPDGTEIYTIDGGDVLRMKNRLYIGVSSRTRLQTITFLIKELQVFNLEVIPFEVPEGLHLKSGVSCIADKVFVIQESFAHPWRELHETINEEIVCHVVSKKEKLAANVLPIESPNGKYIIMPPNCDDTYQFILNYYSKENIKIADDSEFNKVDGALTCKSLLYAPLMKVISEFI